MLRLTMQGNILIIEDIKELSELIALYLSRDGFEVRAAEIAEKNKGAGFTITIPFWKWQNIDNIDSTWI